MGDTVWPATFDQCTTYIPIRGCEVSCGVGNLRVNTLFTMNTHAGIEADGEVGP